MSILGEQLRQLRRTHESHKGELARQAGITCRALELIEAGRSIPKADTLEGILVALGTSPKDADNLRRLRAESQAKRDGLDVTARDAKQISRLTNRLVADAVTTLRRLGVEIDRQQQGVLRKRFDHTIRLVLEPNDSPSTTRT